MSDAYGSGNAGVASLRWWDDRYKDNAARADACFRWVNHVMQRHELRHRIHLFNAQLYDDLPTLGLGPYQYAVFDIGSERLRMNLVKCVTDTYVSMIARSKPKPQALTSDGDWSLKKKAKGLTRWFEGKAEELKLYRDVSNPLVRDSAVFGLGVAQVFREWPNDKELWDVGVERAFPWELIGDDAEWQTPRRARNLARRKIVDRQVVAEMFPAHKDYVLHHATRLGPVQSTFDWGVDTTADLIAVTELWHLPSYPGATDGRHCIVVMGKTLYDGPWNRQRFPFAFCYRSRPTMGLWGLSIPHELRGMQMHINQALYDIEECLHLYAKPRWMAAAGSVEKDALDDDVDSILEWTGQQPPVVYSPKAMPDEVYNFLWQVWQKGFEEIGISQARSQGQTPEGISGSGASIRAWNDVEDGRFYEASQNFEDCHMQIADLMIDEARDIAEEKPDFASAYRGKTYVEIIHFRDVDPGRDKFYLRVFPISRLSTSPAQRLAQLQELFNAKVIDAESFREMLEFPDLEAEDNLMNSPRELAEKLITRFLEADDPEDPEVFQYPEPEWPLAQMKARMQFAEIRARLDGAPEGNCRLLRNFIQLCDKLAAQAAMAAAPGAQTGAAGLAPGPPPPNVAQFPPGTLSPAQGPQQPTLQ